MQGLFDVTIFSSEHGCIKPATRLFELALEGLGASPAKAVHVGDSLKRDVAGAKAAGCAAVLINGHAEALDPRVSRAGFSSSGICLSCQRAGSGVRSEALTKRENTQ